MFFLGISVIGIFVGIYFFKKGKALEKDVSELEAGGFWIIVVSIIVFFLFLLPSSIGIVDEGETILLTEFGEIYDTVEQPGLFVMRPWSSTVSWQVRLESVTQTLKCRTKDNNEITIDATFYWRPDSNKLKETYRYIAKDYDTLKEKFIIPSFRSGTRIATSEEDFDQIMEKVSKMETSIIEFVKEKFKSRNSILDRVDLRKITPPKIIDDAIQEKLEMKQKILTKQNEKALAVASAEIKVIEAQGVRDSQDIIKKTLTPMYLQYESIQMMRTLAGSQNTTFIFSPMGKNTGMPSIYGSAK